MSKKGYQKRLPAILPPTAGPPSLPAPRRTPESVAQPVPIQVVAPVRAVEPSPVPDGAGGAPGPHRRSPGFVIGIGAIVLVSLAAAGFLVFVITGPRTDAPEQAASAGGSAPDPPRMLAGRESYVQTRVLANGGVVVRQWIRSDEPLSQLTLSLPTIPGGTPLAATRVAVLAEGEPVDGPTSITRRPVTYAFDETVDLQLSYRLAGAVERSSSAAGRALAVTTSLDVSYAPLAEQETRVVRAGDVLSLACSPSPQEPPVPCGTDDGDGQWRVELTGAHVVDRVSAAVTIG